MRFFLLVSLIILCQSCIKKMLRSVGVIDNKVTLKKINFADKEILFLPMVHLSEPQFYEQCQRVIDSLVNKGYFIFGEGVSTKKGNLTTGKDTLNMKKIRKVVGIDPFNLSANKIIMNWSKKYNVILQPRSLYVEKDTIYRKIVDYSVEELVNFYEREKGVIVLDECDLNTSLDKEYTCQKANKENRKYFMEEIALKRRNELIAKTIKTSSKNKILLIYGAKHYEGIKEILKE